MKSLTLTLLIAFSGFASYAQLNVKETNKSLAKIKDNLYASAHEVSNGDYHAFINYLAQTKSSLLSIAQVDSDKWTESIAYNQPYIKYYFSYAAYKDYPVVNVSYEAAKLYCNWLTEQYNASPRRKFKKVVFHLPTEKEWMMAARGGDSSAIYPWGNVFSSNLYKGEMMCNYRSDSVHNADVTAPVYSYLPNKFGLYNMCGNVAEMVSEKGIAKGGSWVSTADYLRIDKDYNYDGNAHDYIGFRYFVDVIEK